MKIEKENNVRNRELRQLSARILRKKKAVKRIFADKRKYEGRSKAEKDCVKKMLSIEIIKLDEGDDWIDEYWDGDLDEYWLGG